MQIRKTLVLTAVALVAMVCLMPVDQACSASQKSRDVLVVYSSSNGQTPHENNIFTEAFGAAANYLGLRFHYIDVDNATLPSDKDMDKYVGFVSVFNSNVLLDVNAYLKWFSRQLEQGRKALVLNWLPSVGVDKPLESSQLIIDAYKSLGLVYGQNVELTRGKIRLVQSNATFYPYERTLPVIPPSTILGLSRVSNATDSILTLRDTATGRETTVASVSPSGGFVLADYLYWMDPIEFRKQLYLNPFELLKKSFQLETFPVPDPTTLGGLRVAFTHVDGDAFSGFTNIDVSKNCADILFEQIFTQYDFPFSLSVIAAEINPEDKGQKDLVEQARTIFALPNVEPASHSYTHPFFWDQSKKNLQMERFDVVGAYSDNSSGFDAEKEILGSCGWIQDNLLVTGKQCKVLYWSGMCDPTESQLAMAEQAGILNLNGGDTLYDEIHESMTSVSPLYKKVGSKYQIYTGQANENILTNLWSGPFWGFRNIIETFKRTEKPYRLKPIDVYYHFYSAEFRASLKALKVIYDWVMAQPVSKVYASQYIQMVNGFISTEISEDEAGWTVSEYGKCTTLRLPENATEPDLQRSKGVIGYNRIPQGLYIHLEEGRSSARVVLKQNATQVLAKKDNATAKRRPQGYIRTCGGRVSRFETSSARIRFQYSCFGGSPVTIAGMEPNKNATVLNGQYRTRNLVTDENGVLAIDNVHSGTVEIRLP